MMWFQAYSYPQKEEFLQAKIFNGKSILEIWGTIDIWSIDGCDVEERLPVLLGLMEGPIRGQAK